MAFLFALITALLSHFLPLGYTYLPPTPFESLRRAVLKSGGRSVYLSTLPRRWLVGGGGGCT